jgi:serine/threonine protein kinase
MKAVDELAHELKGGIVSLKAFEKVSLVGKGGFGEVWKAIHKPTGVLCAVKMLYMADDDEETAEMYVREVKVLAQCKSSLFLLRLLGFSVTKPFFIVTPFIKGGSLYDYVNKKSTKMMPPTNKTLIAMGVAFGLMNLHKMGIIHRDLKSPNILLDERLLPYICDFGISRLGNAKMTKNIGTTYWMAPEQMESFEYNEKVDIYSFGCVLYEMVRRKIPFENETTYKAAIMVMNGERPPLPKYEKKICDLITICWDQDPKKRPSARKIMKMFVQKKVYFEGTDMKGVNALLGLISKEDEGFTSKMKKWIRHAARSSSVVEEPPEEEEIEEKKKKKNRRTVRSLPK